MQIAFYSVFNSSNSNKNFWTSVILAYWCNGDFHSWIANKHKMTPSTGSEEIVLTTWIDAITYKTPILSLFYQPTTLYGCPLVLYLFTPVNTTNSLYKYFFLLLGFIYSVVPEPFQKFHNYFQHRLWPEMELWKKYFLQYWLSCRYYFC